MRSMKNSDTSFRNFKKKNSNIPVDPPKSTGPEDKLSTLRSKIQKQKQTMNKTGKRFREDNKNVTLDISIGTDPIPKKSNDVKTAKAQTGTESRKQLKKQNISLKEIGLQNNATQDSLQSSRVFQQQIAIQKKRRKEIEELLRTIQLEKFTDSLIQSGFDDIDTLLEITNQDLNHIMMRAHEQQRLMKYIKQRKGEKSTSPAKRNITSRKSRNIKPKTEQSFSQKSYSSSNIHQGNKIEKLNTMSSESSSFFASIGGKNWSFDDQIRRACSGCFKLTSELKKKGQCFYCERCFDVVAPDLLALSIDTSMKRLYRKE